MTSLRTAVAQLGDAAGDIQGLRLEAVPIALDFCFTRLADTDEAGWITERFRHACAALGTDVHTREGRLVITLSP